MSRLTIIRRQFSSTVMIGVMSSFCLLASEATLEIDAVFQDTIRIMSQTEDPQQRKQQLEAEIYPHFDFAQMAVRSMGRNWLGLNADQRTEFTALFTKLIANVLLERLSGNADVNNSTYEVKREQILREYDQKIQDGTRHVAENRIDILLLDERQSINLSFFMSKIDDQPWKIADVVIEGISIVGNFRSQFNALMRGRGGFTNLITKLKKKVGNA